MRQWIAAAAALAVLAACSNDNPATTASSSTASIALDSLSMRAGDSVLPAASITVDGQSRVALPSEFIVTSSDTNVIAVASNGALLGINDGVATVTVMYSKNQSITASRTLTVSSETLTGVNLIAPLSMIPGDTATFVVTGTTRFGRVTQPASVTVTSRNAAVVRTTGNLAIAVAPGSAWVVARASTGVSDSTFVTVAVGTPTTLALAPHTATLTVGGTLQASVVMYDRRNNLVTNATPNWSTSSAAVATVSNGLVTAVGAGSAFIIARINNAADTLKLTVNSASVPAPVLGSLTVTPQTVTMKPGDTVRITAKAFDTNGNAMTLPSVTWASLNDGITVSSTGLITAAASLVASIPNGVVQVSSGSIAARVGVNVVYTAPAPPPTQPVTPPPSNDNGYVQIVWVNSTPSAAVQAAFEAARQRINGLFNSFNGVTAVNPNIAAGYCLTGAPALNQTVNGIVLFVQVTAIDGVGQILGSSGPCLIRSGSYLPIVGTMKFDSADMDAMVSSGLLNGVVLHEMMHTLGFGTIWGPTLQDEVASPNGSDPRYTAAGGRTEYAALGATDAASGVPVENTGGSGTKGAHWRESTFNGELMTGWANGNMAMSRVTIAALKDFGYDVNLGKADSYTLGAYLMAGSATQGSQLGETTTKPIGVLTASGQVIPYTGP